MSELGHDEDLLFDPIPQKHSSSRSINVTLKNSSLQKFVMVIESYIVSYCYWIVAPGL